MITERFAGRAWAVAALAAAVAIGAPVLVTPVLAAPAAPVPPASPNVPAAPAPPTAPTTPPSITLDRSTGLLRGQIVNITGTGFPFGGATIVECNNTPGQPTVSISGFDVPFSPGSPSGSLRTTFIVQTGIIGPPILGIDSARNNSAADAANYPCPPTAAQQAAGASCTISAGAVIYGPSSFPSVPNQPPTVISASVPITFGTPVATHPSISASPSTALSSGQVVSVTGTGFTPDSPGQVVECNLTPGEPTNGYGSYPLPVGCTSLYPTLLNSINIGFRTGAAPPVIAPPAITGPAPSASSARTAAVATTMPVTPTTAVAPPSPAGPQQIGIGSPAPNPNPPVLAPGSFLTTSTGTFSTTVAIREGDIGGGNTAAAAAYPCPPTPANLAAGGSSAPLWPSTLPVSRPARRSSSPGRCPRPPSPSSPPLGSLPAPGCESSGPGSSPSHPVAWSSATPRPGNRPSPSAGGRPPLDAPTRS